MIAADAILFFAMAYLVASLLFKGDKHIAQLPIVPQLTSVLGMYTMCTALTLIVFTFGSICYYMVGVLLDGIGAVGILYHFFHQEHFGWDDIIAMILIVHGAIITKLYFMKLSLKDKINGRSL